MKLRPKIFRILIAIILGLIVLMLSSVIMMEISLNTSVFDDFSIIKKTFQHSAMVFFSLLIIIIINKGNLRNYGFRWNWNFPFLKVVLISLLFGFTSMLIGRIIPVSIANNPVVNFNIIEKILYIWIFASISEEVFTRGLIQSFLSPLKSTGIYLFGKFISIPVIVGALFFGLMHLALLSMGMNILFVINIVFFAIILGLIAGYQKEKTDSLIPAIIVHICSNVGGSILTIL